MNEDRRVLWRLAWLWCLGLMILARPSHAQTASVASDHADRLFREAIDLMETGSFSEACPKLKESYRLDPAGGTVLNLAYCLEKLGKLASAYAAYDEAVTRAKADDREDRASMARARLAALQSKLAYVRITLGAQVTELPNLAVTLDGKRLSKTELSGPVAVDAGRHILRITASDRLPFEQNLEIPDAPKTLEVSVDRLIEHLPETASAQKSNSVVIDKGSSTKAVERPLTAPFWIATVTSGVLLAACLTTGSIAWYYKDRDNDTALDWAYRSTALGAAGAGAGGVALYFWLSRPKTPASSSATTKVQFYPSYAQVRF